MRAVNLLQSKKRSGPSAASLSDIRPGHLAAVVLAGLAVMAVLYGSARKQTLSYEAETAAVKTQVQAAQRAAAKYAAASAAVPVAEQRVANAMKVAETRFGWAPLLHHLAVYMPSGVEFSTLSVTLESGSTTSTGLAPKPVEPGTASGAAMDLAGCADSHRDVAQMIRSLRWVKGVTKITFESSTKSSSAGGGGGSSEGGCPPGGPKWTMTVTLAAPSVPTSTGPARVVFLGSDAKRSRKK